MGVNKYTVANEQPPPVRVIDNSAVQPPPLTTTPRFRINHRRVQVLKAQVAKLKHVKETRDPERAAKALDAVRAAAADASVNLLGAPAAASGPLRVGLLTCGCRRVHRGGQGALHPGRDVLRYGNSFRTSRRGRFARHRRLHQRVR